MAERTRFRKANPVKISHVVQSLVNDMGMGEDVFLKKVADNWQSIVGTVVARNTRPISLSDGVLNVAVSTPSWYTQAQFNKANILKNIREYDSGRGGDIGDISFTLKNF